jgi:hypothetical protein
MYKLQTIYLHQLPKYLPIFQPTYTYWTFSEGVKLLMEPEVNPMGHAGKIFLCSAWITVWRSVTFLNWKLVALTNLCSLSFRGGLHLRGCAVAEWNRKSLIGP